MVDEAFGAPRADEPRRRLERARGCERRRATAGPRPPVRSSRRRLRHRATACHPGYGRRTAPGPHRRRRRTPPRRTTAGSARRRTRGGPRRPSSR